MHIVSPVWMGPLTEPHNKVSLCLLTHLGPDDSTPGLLPDVQAEDLCLLRLAEVVEEDALNAGDVL